MFQKVIVLLMLIVMTLMVGARTETVLAQSTSVVYTEFCKLELA